MFQNELRARAPVAQGNRGVVIAVRILRSTMRSTAFLAGCVLFLATMPVARADEPAAAWSHCGSPHCRACVCASHGDWHVAETANFSVWSRHDPNVRYAV